MGFLDRIAAGAEFRAVSGLRNPAGWFTDVFTGGASFSGERVGVNDAFGLAPVFAAVSIIAETVAQLPFKVFRKIDDDERIVAEDHRMYRVLHDRPNPAVSADRYWSTVTAQLLLHGNHYSLKERDDVGAVQALWMLDPSEITVEWNGREKTFLHRTSQGERRYSSDDVLHIYGLSTNGLVGESVISRCRNTFGTNIARSKFEGGFYRRGARSPAVIHHPGRLGEEGTKRLSQQFGQWHAGVDAMHKVPVLEEGAKLEPLSMPLTDMQFVEQQQLSRSEIAILFRIPPSYLGASSGDSLTYATIESNQIQFAQLAIAPWTNTIAKAIYNDLSLFPLNAWYPEFVLEGMLKADAKSRAEYWKELHAMKVVDAEFIASRENLPKPKPEPKTEPPTPPENGQQNGQVLPATMQQMQDALRESAG